MRTRAGEGTRASLLPFTGERSPAKRGRMRDRAAPVRAPRLRPADAGAILSGAEI